jgi:hypothetical protein
LPANASRDERSPSVPQDNDTSAVHPCTVAILTLPVSDVTFP